MVDGLVRLVRKLYQPGIRTWSRPRQEKVMRLAVSAKGDTISSDVDQRFGRCKFFLVYDTETGETEVHSNEVNLNAEQGAGIQSASNAAKFGVEVVLTGHVGPNSFRTLSVAGIRVYTGLNGTVEQAIKQFTAGELTPVESADVEGHWVI